MARSSYSISLAKDGYAGLWRQHYVDEQPTDASKKAYKAGCFADDLIEAASLAEAVLIAEDRHPGWTVMQSGSGRLG